MNKALLNEFVVKYLSRPLCILVCLLMVHVSTSALAATLEENFASAQAAYKAEKFQEAAKLFMKTATMLLDAQQFPQAQSIMGNAAVCYMKDNDFAAAAGVYEQILAMKAKPAPEMLQKVYNNLVVCLGNAGLHGQKVIALENMLKAIPKLPAPELSDLHARLGDAYRALELYSLAEASYAKAESLLPKNADPEILGRILTARGLCLGNLGDFAGAAKSLAAAKALAKAANAPQTLAEVDSNLGILNWERGEYPQAVELLKAALSTEQKHALRRNEGVDRNNLGLVQKSMGHLPAAMLLFEESLGIAREVGNKRDEAIALANRALVHRIGGDLNEARADYRAALKLYEETGFQEGKAGVLMGIAKIAELEDRDLEVALNGYQEALEIYTRLEMPRGQAEAFLQVGGVLKKVLAPGRATRDLVFDDEPQIPKIDNKKALTGCRNAYTKALKLAEAVGSREMNWASRQGIGFVLSQEGKLEEAMEQYMKAIDAVTAMRVSLESVELLGEYMAGKEDLYEEAMALCASLYEKTKDPKYLSLQMRLGDTMRNEVQKASAALVQLNFADAKKQALYSNLNALAKSQARAEAAVPVLSSPPAKENKEAVALHDLQKKEAEKQKANVQKMDKDYQKMLADWKKQYPGDAIVFESSSRVNIPDVQKALGPDQLMLQYISLSDQLVIMAVSKDKVDCATVKVSKKEINDLIKKDFLVKYIEEYGHKSKVTKAEEEEYLKISVGLLAKLHGWLIEPVSASLKGKKRLYVVTDGFLAQVPFGALVQSIDNGVPTFLVENYDVSYVRPSFIDSLTKPKAKASIKTLLAAGNPRNNKLFMSPLEGAVTEIKKANEVIPHDTTFKDIMYEDSASESWLKNTLRKSQYEFLYFATHGMPHSETYYKFNVTIKNGVAGLQKKQEKDPTPKREATINRYLAETAFIEKQLPGLSPLNGFLYMGDAQDNSEDGLFTLKEIMELSEKDLASTRYVLLSACNTGVTFAPAALEDELMEEKFSAVEVENDLRKIGWVPGLDQISFVDAFMRRGVNNVYGTLWFASDEASQYLMSNFMNNMMAQGDRQDAVVAFSDAQRKYIEECKAGKTPLGSAYPVPLNPFFWGVGAMFGK